MGLGPRKGLGPPEKERKKMKGRRGPRSLTGKNQSHKTGTIEIFSNYMESWDLERTEKEETKIV